MPTLRASILGGATGSTVDGLRRSLADRGIVLATGSDPAASCALVLTVTEIPNDAGSTLSEGDDGFADRVCACVTPAFEGMRGAMELLRPTGGTVVNLVIDRSDRRGNGLLAAAIRGGVANLTRSVALHAGKSGYGIRVNGIYLMPHVGRDAALDAAADAIGWLSGTGAGFVTGVELVIGRDANT